MERRRRAVARRAGWQDARVQMAEFLALPVEVYLRRSVSDAQKTVREQVREHGSVSDAQKTVREQVREHGRLVSCVQSNGIAAMPAIKGQCQTIHTEPSA